jgi:hypothetical protein
LLKDARFPRKVGQLWERVQVLVNEANCARQFAFNGWQDEEDRQRREAEAGALREQRAGIEAEAESRGEARREPERQRQSEEEQREIKGNCGGRGRSKDEASTRTA